MGEASVPGRDATAAVLFQGTRLIRLPRGSSGYYGGYANDINEHDQIVGTTADYGGDDYSAWLWTRKSS